MPPEQITDRTWPARLRLERVAQGDRVVVTVPESFGDLTQTRSVLLKQGGMGVTEYVPPDTSFLAWTKCFVENTTRLGVRAGDREIQEFQDHVAALIEWDESFAAACLRAVHRPRPVPGAPDMEEPVSNIVMPDGECFTDPQARQEAQFGEEPPLPRHPADDVEEFLDGDVMPAFSGHRDSKSLRWRW